MAIARGGGAAERFPFLPHRPTIMVFGGDPGRFCEFRDRRNDGDAFGLSENTGPAHEERVVLNFRGEAAHVFGHAAALSTDGLPVALRMISATSADGPICNGTSRTRADGWAIRWKPALNAVAITFEGRIVSSTTN
jgi:hypothetical protein